MKNKSYRASPIGEEVGRFMRALQWGGNPKNTRDTYEIVLARLAIDFAHIQLADLTTEMVRDFLAEHWGDAAAATRTNRLAAVKSFLRWAVDEGRLDRSPADPIKRPKKAVVERQAYSMDVVDQLRRAQPDLRDQIAIQLLGRLALRKDELRQTQVRDFDLQRGTVVVHGKGGKVVVLPLGFDDLKTDLHLHLIDRHPDEYLLYPKGARLRPMDHASVHRWFKGCLRRAGLPESIKIHEMRHSAADHLWRKSGDIVLAQQLLRHESPGTTAAYLHPTRDDLAAALAALEEIPR